MRGSWRGDGPRPMADAARAKHREERFRLVFPFTRLNLTNPSVGSRTCRPRTRQIFPPADPRRDPGSGQHVLQPGGL